MNIRMVLRILGYVLGLSLIHILILVLDLGRVIERGTHGQLIAQKGEYYQLCTGAFELE